jgi:tRNA A-37 threonylcarbamoyl transferase component Bud32
MRALLQLALPQLTDGPLAVTQLRISKVRRSSSRHRHPVPLTLCYELDVADAATETQFPRHFYGQVFRGGASAKAAQGTPALHLPEVDMLLWPWPHDPGLPQLPQLLDPLKFADFLPASCLVDGHSVTLVETLRYEPERRATLRYTLSGNEAPAPRMVYGKTFSDDHAGVLHERFVYFWRLAQRDVSAPCVAEPLGFDAATRTLWQAAACGQTLISLADTAEATRAFRAVGRALTHLHQAPLDTNKQRPLSHWLAELQRRQVKLVRAVPALGPRVAAIAEGLAQAARDLPEAPQTLIHGDFHPDQVWINAGRVVLFDFDEFALGNPMEDLAEFIVKLEQAELPAPQCAAAIAALIAGYRSAAPWHFEARGLLWHRAMQSLLQASRAFIYQRPGWRDELALRLARTEERLALVLKGHTA